MASGLFGSGPQSNILQTVQSSYNGMLNAEKQKGLAMREAMGAFGQAIDPKTIGMNKFKKQFANADWTKPQTYFDAANLLGGSDPAAAISMTDKGMQIQASQTPKPVEGHWQPSFRFIDGKKVQGSINRLTGDFKSAGGEGEEAATSTFKLLKPVEFTNPVSKAIELRQQQEDGSWKVIGMAANQRAPDDGAPDSREVWDAKIQANILQEWDPVGKVWSGAGLAPKSETGPSTVVNVGIGDGTQDLTSANKTAIQKQIIAAKGGVKKLKSMGDKLDDDFLTYWGKAGASLGSVLDQMGISPDTPLVGKAVKHASKARAFHNEVQQMFNAYRKEITGAAAAVKELKRLEDAFLTDKNMGPETFKLVREQMEQTYLDGIEELKSYAVDGVKVTSSSSFGDMSEDQVDVAYAAMMKEIEKEGN